MLVTMKEMLQKASKENYAVAAPNIGSEFEARAFIEAAEELNAPIILDINLKVIKEKDSESLGRNVANLAKQAKVPVALNLDHGNNLKQIYQAIQGGYSSVMFDKSSLPYEDNVKQVKEVCEIAHSLGLSVEAEFGHVGFADNYEQDRNAALTDPVEARKFIEETGVDCLAVAIGTAHGAYPKGFVPYLDFDRLKMIKEETNGFPLVLHGSSGTKDEDLYKACRSGINKVNVYNDIVRHIVDTLKETDLEGKAAYKVFDVIYEAEKSKLKDLIILYGSQGKA